MKDTLLFSIIVPIYKVENYLEQCIQSLINQTYPKIEIILVDDGSPDKCPELCDIYAKRDRRIKVIHKENEGLSIARNVGLREAKGEYVLFVDSDDNIALNTCEMLLPFTKIDCDIIIGDDVLESHNEHYKHGNVSIGVICSGKEYMKIAYKNKAMPMAVWLNAYKRGFLENKKLYFKEKHVHEDEHFTPRAFLEAEAVVESGVCFYNYMIREDSITTRKDLRKNATDMYAICLELLKIFEKVEDFELRELMIDSLVVKYLSLFQQGKLYQYGKKYYHKRFIWNNAKQKKTRLKAILFCASPFLYWHINDFTKK